MKKLCTLWLALIPWLGYGQSASAPFGFRYNQQPTISVDGRALLNPWAGGLNTMLFATLRLNDDNRDDLLVYDRTSRKASTFVAIDNPTGSGIAWQYAPAYETMLPPLSGWVVAVDYDGDGRKDLFSLADSDVRVYHNDSQSGKVVFSVAAQTLMTVGFGGRQVLYVSAVDMPAILDYDDDGDIDILAFDASGNLIAYQQNMSVERTGKKDGLDFKRPDCFYWGHFLKEFCNDFVFGINCDGTQSGKSVPLKPTTGAARPMHSGNTLAVMDTDGDGKKDLLFGAISCPGIARLANVGTNDSAARFTRFDTLFPAKNPVLFPAYAGVYSEDVDGDGIRDLLASPFVDQNENDQYDFRASGWYYKNAGTNAKPDFQLKQKDFLQNDMLDLGENAVPALADLDGDGDMDLLVGYAGAQTGKGYRAGIWQFENKGTLQNPAFSLVTTDYLSLAQSLTLVNTMPTFADVDGNGSLDLIVTGTGASSLEIRLFPNAAAKGAPVQYSLPTAIRWPNPDLMQLGERLLVTDLDRDGKVDVLLGKNNGLIHYFHNTGTATVPVFQLQSQNFGNLPTTFYTGASSLVLADLNGDQKNEFITASGDGKVKLYQFPDALTGPLTLLDSLPALGLPGLNLAAATADLDGDGLPDLLLGTGGGGLRYLKNTSQKVVVTGLPTETTGPWAFPNPTDRYLTIRAPHDGQVDLLSLSGQTVLAVQSVKGDTEQMLDLGSLPEGTYLLRLTAPGKVALVEKIVIWK